jgi:hypothetical protein
MPGRGRAPPTATATEVASTSPREQRDRPRLALKSRSDVKNAAAQRTGGRRRRNDESGIELGIVDARRSPAGTRGDLQDGRRHGQTRASAGDGHDHRANAMALTIGG